MTSNFVFSMMYIVASIHVSGWGGCSLVVVLVATPIVVLSRNAAAAAFLSKSRQFRSLKVSEAAGGALGGTDEVSVAWGRVTRAVGTFSCSYFSGIPRGVSP